MGTCSGGSAKIRQVIDKASIKDHTWSTKKMEGDESLNLNTVECLRGRLLAERHASRVAKEEAESLGNKLVELERVLREEMKLREKAERKLTFLRKKLESYNMPSMSKQVKHSDSSEICEHSCGSSSVSSTSKHSEANETKHHAKNAVDCHNVVASSALIHTHNSPSTTKDCDSQVTDNSSCNSDPVYSFPKFLMENPNPSSEGLKNDERRLSNFSSKSSLTENEDDKGNFCDDSLAIVPVNVTETSHGTSNSKPFSESVHEALDALKHARESLQISMGTRQMIHVGPS